VTPEPSVPPHLAGLGYVQPLGAGGYADVYLYEQQNPRRLVVVKALRTLESPSAACQFVNEAHAMAGLAGHPHVLQLLRAEAAPDGRPCLVMDYCPPPNIAVRARRQPFTLQQMLRTGIELAGAVETAHRASIVHRDIKPANILVTPTGVLTLADWGTASCGLAVDHDDDVAVSVPWAAPELLFGGSDGNAATDVYSLAATLWQLLAGRSPFAVPEGDNTAYALMDRIQSQPAPATGRPDVPIAMERLLARALDKDPAVRPATAAEFARQLQAVESQLRLPRTALVIRPSSEDTPLARRRGTGHRKPAAMHSVRAPVVHLPGGTCIAAAPPTPLVDTSLRRPIAVPSGAMPLMVPAP
jgi:serine/threonine protein kinase